MSITTLIDPVVYVICAPLRRQPLRTSSLSGTSRFRKCHVTGMSLSRFRRSGSVSTRSRRSKPWTGPRRHCPSGSVCPSARPTTTSATPPPPCSPHWRSPPAGSSNSACPATATRSSCGSAAGTRPRRSRRGRTGQPGAHTRPGSRPRPAFAPTGAVTGHHTHTWPAENDHLDDREIDKVEHRRRRAARDERTDQSPPALLAPLHVHATIVRRAAPGAAENVTHLRRAPGSDELPDRPGR